MNRSIGFSSGILPLGVILLSVILLVPVVGVTTKELSKRTVEEKLGYVPSRDVLRMASLDHKSLLGNWLFFKVITYYGGRIDPEFVGEPKGVEYFEMYRHLDAVTYIDPYNIDAYYFSEAIFTWGLGRIKEVNRLLERGLKYRTWDFYIPFFLGFNNFYFLKDYESASRYMTIAARLKGDPLLVNLSARLLYESARTEVAIAFLKDMIENTWNEKAKAILIKRLHALEAVDYLEKAVKRFESIYNRRPEHMRELLDKGIINRIPEDPYGGEFYIEGGKIKTTSMFVQRDSK